MHDAAGLGGAGDVFGDVRFFFALFDEVVFERDTQRLAAGDHLVEFAGEEGPFA